MPKSKPSLSLPAQLRERASWLINAGADDTLRGLNAMTGTPEDIAVLNAAIAQELAKPKLSQRTSRLKPITAKLRKFAGTMESLTAEAVEVMPTQKHDPAWDNARLYYRAVRTTGRQFLVSQICLGWELSDKKKALGFGHGANKAGPSGQFGHTERTWEQWVHQEIDENLPRRTADRLIQVFEGFCEKVPKKLRVAFTGGSRRSLLTTLSKPPGSLTVKERETIELAITKCSDGETQRSLLEELSLVKVHVSLKGGDTSGSKKDKPSDSELMGQLAFKFFQPIAESLQRLRSDNDREAYLHAIDLTSSDEDAITLVTLERDLLSALHDVQSAKKARLKTTTGTVIATA